MSITFCLVMVLSRVVGQLALQGDRLKCRFYLLYFTVLTCPYLSSLIGK